MNYTANYQLPQWVETDRILMDDFNDSYEKIDAALKTNADGLSAETAARTAGDAAKGCGEVCSTSYKGTGSTGASGATTLTFPWPPALVVVISTDASYLFAMRGCTWGPHNYNQVGRMELHWSGNTLSWYANSANQQLNAAGKTYCVTAFGIAAE